MKRKILFLIFLVFFIKIAVAQEKNDIDKIFNLNIEKRFISKGDNFPDFGTKKDSMSRLLIALHKDFSVNDFQKYTKFDDKKKKK